MGNRSTMKPLRPLVGTTAWLIACVCAIERIRSASLLLSETADLLEGLLNEDGLLISPKPLFKPSRRSRKE